MSSTENENSVIANEFTSLYSYYTQIDELLISLDTSRDIPELSEKSFEIKQLIKNAQQKLKQIHEKKNSTPAKTSPPPPPPMENSLSPLSLLPASMNFSTSNFSPSQSFSSLYSHHSQLINSYPAKLRQQLIKSKATISSNTSKIRRELFNTETKNNSSPSASLITARHAESEFRSSLNQTTSLLTSALELSSASLSSLNSSTETLRGVDKQNSVYRRTLHTGSRLITAQHQRQRTDRIIIAIGCAFFVSVCIFILNKRMRVTKMIGIINMIGSNIIQIFTNLVTATLTTTTNSYSQSNTQSTSSQSYEHPASSTTASGVFYDEI